MVYQTNENKFEVTLKGPATYDDLDETWDDVSIHLFSKYLNNINNYIFYVNLFMTENVINIVQKYSVEILISLYINCEILLCDSI